MKLPTLPEAESNYDTLAEKILVRAVHFSLTPALHISALEKGSRLLRHEDHIVRVRIDLERDHIRGDSDRFIAKGRIEVSGPDLVAAVESEDPYKSIDLLVDRLDRMLRERSRSRVDRRNDRAAGTEFRDRLAVNE